MSLHRPPWAVEEAFSSNNIDVPSSIWRVHMHRQFESLLLASKANLQARKLCKETFGKLKVDVGVVVGSVYVSKAENDRGSASTSNQIIHNPNGSRKKGQRNVRKKNMFCSRHRGDATQSQVEFFPQSQCIS